MNHLHFLLSLQCTLQNDNLFQKWPTSFEYMQQGSLYQNVNIFKAENIFSLVWEDKIFQKLLCSIFLFIFFSFLKSHVSSRSTVDKIWFIFIISAERSWKYLASFNNPVKLTASDFLSFYILILSLALGAALFFCFSLTEK